jgi:hypothetical protein
MAFLVVGAVTVPVQQEGATQRPDAVVGSVRRTFGNRLVSSLRTPKREWEFDTRPLTAAEETTLKAAIGLGTTVTVTGDGVGGGSVSAKVFIDAVEYVPKGTGFERVLTLVVQEV